MGPKDEIDEAERYFIKKYNTLWPNGWNFTSGGQECKELSREVIERIRIAHFKPILRYDMYTGILKSEYNSMNAAANDSGQDVSNICACAKGKRIYVGDSVYRYKLTEEAPRQIDVTYVSEYIQQVHVNRSKACSLSHKGHITSLETRRKQSEIAKAQGRKPPNHTGKPSYMKGKHLDPDVAKERYAKTLKNHPDYGDKIRMVRKKGKDSYQACSVYQRDRKGNILARFETIREASTATGIPEGLISRCIKGKYKEGGGFIWTYTEDSAIKYNAKIIIPRLTVIRQYDLAGNLVGEFQNNQEAGKAAGTHPRNISRAIHGHTPLCKGYVWKKEWADN